MKNITRYSVNIRCKILKRPKLGRFNIVYYL